MQFDDHMLKVQIDQDADGNRMVEESMRVWNSDQDRDRSSSSVAPRSTIDYLPGTREMRGATVTVARRRRQAITVTNTPLRTLYLAAGSGYVNLDGWGHGVYQGPLKVEGLVHDLVRPRGAAQVRRSSTRPCAGSRPTPARSGTACTRTCSIGIYRPTGFHTPDAVAP